MLRSEAWCCWRRRGLPAKRRKDRAHRGDERNDKKEANASAKRAAKKSHPHQNKNTTPHQNFSHQSSLDCVPYNIASPSVKNDAVHNVSVGAPPRERPVIRLD